MIFDTFYENKNPLVSIIASLSIHLIAYDLGEVDTLHPVDL